MENLKNKWDKIAANMLVGKTIKKVSYMNKAECNEFGWHQAAVVIELDNGLVIFPSQDDEGNGPGALFTSDDKHPTLPTI